MQAGTLAGSDVMTFTSRVLVNGTQRPVMSWSVDRDLVGDLPEQVVAGGGISQATGSVTWGSDLDVNTGAVNPWNPSTGWIPKEGDSVQIFAGDNVTEWSQFVGVIDSSNGDIGGGFSSKIVDRIDDFSRKMRLPALVDVMPPVDVSLEFRRFRLSPRFYVMTAMRRAGFNLTPPAEAAAVLDLPAVGSMWPLIGDMVTCRRGSNAAESPVWPGGVFVQDVTSTYTPNVARPGSTWVQLTMQRGPLHAGVARIRVLYGTSTVVLSVTATQAQAWVNGVNVCFVPVTSECIVSYLFKNGQVEIRSSLGGVATGSASWSVTTLLSKIEVLGDTNSHFNGVQVSNPTQAWHEFASINFTPTARITTGDMHDTLEACPSTGDQSARDLLEEIGQALMWPFWIDETGTAKAIASDALRGQASMQTITTKDDIRSLSWSRDLLGARSEIITSYDEWAINRSSDYSVELWSSSESVVLQSGQEHATFIEEPDGEAWLMVDETLTVPGIDSLYDASRGIGTMAGGVYTDGVTENWAALPGIDKLTASITRVNEGTWVIKHTAGTLAAGYQVELRTVSEDFSGGTTLFPYWWGKELPIFRGKGKANRTSKTRNPTIAGNNGPVLELDCKHWATGHLESNRTRVVDAVTNFVSEQVVNPMPVITGMRVGFDPRRQLGDVITVSSPDFMGVELKCLVTSVSNSASGSYEQNLSVRIISAESTYTTYAGFAEAWGSTADYDSFAAAWDAISTYTDLNNDPLRGTN